MRLPAAIRRLVFRQKYRARIRADQEKFLREHPELRVDQDWGRIHWPVPEPTDRTENES